MPTALPTEFGRALPALARAAITAHLAGKPAPAIPGVPALKANGASFVTLTQDGELRGCIGSLRPQRPLGEDILRNAVAAASEDPRFPPLSADALARIRVEVSVLSEAEFLDFSDEADLLRQLVPGEHGLILFSGCRGTTFLPQVWEQLPEPADFLAALKRKAGLPPDRPAPNAMAARYTVAKWSEDA